MGRFAAIVRSRKISALQGRKNVIAGAKASVSSKGQSVFCLHLGRISRFAEQICDRGMQIFCIIHARFFTAFAPAPAIFHANPPYRIAHQVQNNLWVFSTH